MSNIISVNPNQLINFGDYKNHEKLKETMSFNGDIYKLKTYNEVTRLEKNDILIYESVPGTRVYNYSNSIDRVSFDVQGEEEASIILMIEDNRDVVIEIDGKVINNSSFLTNGKLNLNVHFNNENTVKVIVHKDV